MKQIDIQIAEIGQEIISTFSDNNVYIVKTILKDCIETESGEKIKHGNYRIVENIKVGDRVELLRGLVVLTTRIDGETGRHLPKGSIATVESILEEDITLDNPIYYISLKFDSETTINLYMQGLKGFTKVVKLAQ